VRDGAQKRTAAILAFRARCRERGSGGGAGCDGGTGVYRSACGGPQTGDAHPTPVSPNEEEGRGTMCLSPWWVSILSENSARVRPRLVSPTEWVGEERAMRASGQGARGAIDRGASERPGGIGKTGGCRVHEGRSGPRSSAAMRLCGCAATETEEAGKGAMVSPTMMICGTTWSAAQRVGSTTLIGVQGGDTWR